MIWISALALFIGALCAGVAVALSWAITFFTNLFFYHQFSIVFRSPAAANLGVIVLVIPTLGGLVIGLMARFGSDRIRGHGIPEAMEAILIGRSRMQAKIAVLKPLSSAISIGSGGPFGAEGPIIMTGGACGSLIAQAFHLSAAEREYSVDPLEMVPLRDVMTTPVETLLPSARVRDVLERFDGGGPHKHQGFPVVDSHGRLLGMVTRSNLLDQSIADAMDLLVVADVMEPDVVVGYADETCRNAAEKMSQAGVGRIPVVAADSAAQLIGIVTRSDLLKSRARYIEEEGRRERFIRLRFALPRRKTSINQP